MTAAIASENLADAASVTASTQEISLPASNLQNAHIRRKWRSLLPDAYVVFTLEDASDVDTIGLFGIEAETVRARVSAVDPTAAAGEIYDSGVQSVNQAYSSFIGLLPATASTLYVRFDLVTTTDSFVAAGRAVIAARTEFSVNYSYGWERGRTDTSLRTKTRGSQTQVSPNVICRNVTVTFGFLSENEANDLVETIDRINGLQTDVLLILDPDSTNLPRDSYWGLIQENTPVVNPNIGIFSKIYKIEERQ